MNLIKLKQPIALHFNHGNYRIDGPFMVRTIHQAAEQDYKTAMILDIWPIPADKQLKVFSILENYYGTFFNVRYNDRLYNIDPDDCAFIGMIDINECLSDADIRKIKQYLLNKFQPLNVFEINPDEYANKLWEKFTESSDEYKKEIFSEVL